MSIIYRFASYSCTRLKFYDETAMKRPFSLSLTFKTFFKYTSAKSSGTESKLYVLVDACVRPALFCFGRSGVTLASWLGIFRRTVLTAGMHSTVFVTDFDEDYNDDDRTSYDSNISYYQSNNNDDNDSNSINNDVSALCKSRDTESCRVLEFGEFEDNYGWIQCQSKSFPDRVYYYNTRSGCNTWYRPVSRSIDVPVISIRRVSPIPRRDAKLYPFATSLQFPAFLAITERLKVIILE